MNSPPGRLVRSCPFPSSTASSGAGPDSCICVLLVGPARRTGQPHPPAWPALAGVTHVGTDYDQLLAKQPFKTDAVFAWHQDMAYWPDTPDTRTATIWLAIDDSTVANGCMRFVPATNDEAELRPHTPRSGDRGTSHALGTELRPGDEVVPVPIARGDATVHNERVLHGSGGNSTGGFRRAYVVAFRAAETVRIERELGFTHSHDDHADVLDEVGVEGQTR